MCSMINKEENNELNPNKEEGNQRIYKQIKAFGVNNGDKRINLRISSDLHTKAKLISVLKKTTMNQYLENLIQEAISKDEHLIKNLFR